MSTRHALHLAITVPLAAALLSGCVVGPNYQRPAAPIEASFKESQGWTPSQPADGIDRGAWWSIYSDPVLDGLEKRVAISNQNLAAAEAAYRQARGLVAESRAAFFPTVTGNASATRRGGGASSGAAAGSGRDVTSYSIGVGASWAPDLWGRVRRTVEAARANAQAQAADVASARLSYQTELAVDYFNLRVLDAQTRLLNETVANYQQVVRITTNRYNVGTVARADLITAQTQLDNAQAQLIDVGVQRAQLEHAIAVLVGVPPSELSIAPVNTVAAAVPTVPAGVASTLLQRRPDIAAAERTMAAANANIGVAVAAYYPNLTLGGSYGFTSTSLSSLFSASSSTWSIGPSLAATLLDFGARSARVREARAVYDQRVAQYRQTVLAAFQAVEDELAAARVLEQEAAVRTAAETDARRAEQLALNRYNAGQIDFTAVVQAQNTALSSELSSLTTLRSRLTASVSLVEALGGGWTASDLPPA